MLDEAMELKDTASTANKMQNELFQHWMQKSWIPNYIFQTVLHVDEAGDTVFTNPLVMTWIKYAILKANGYSDENVERLVKKFPDDVSSMMGITRAADGLLTNPQFTSWIQYLDDFHVAVPGTDNIMMKTVRKSYDDKALINMIKSALKASSTEKLAKRVEDELFRSWHGSRNTPDGIFKRLKLDDAGSMLLASPLLSTWIRYSTTYNKQKPLRRRT
ncbi:hypothetical protein GQ600_8128 [Phytophthora cactorum]|nr:hypothetical protein GQ600_8128 [Phytophthora cactorum]